MRGVMSKIAGVVMCVMMTGTDIREAGIQAIDVPVNTPRGLITRGVQCTPLAAAPVLVVRRGAAVAIVTAGLGVVEIVATEAALAPGNKAAAT
eukprot:381462-Pleurochrysis_carterae.AAC.1